MRTTIRIDEKVMDELLKVTKVRKKNEAILIAVVDFLKRRSKEKLLSLRGKLNLVDNWRKLRDAELKER